ncbi:TonB family protein [Rivibacter subsaxonicus]|uniref:TonB family protein n=2 Tax=Rivibacter subsaxonicus TaxID=457575 RepID=A0A4V2FUA9_9BURK|nr:TonB family protein [Rivibacter subsaxonicus]
MQRCLEAPGKKSNILSALVLAAVAAMSGSAAMAQSAPAKTSDEMERAQRDADKVFRMIIINSDAPRKKRAVDGGTPAANAPAAPKAPSAVAASSLSPAASAALAARLADPGRPAEVARVESSAPAPAAVQVAAAPAAATVLPGSAAAVLAAPPAAASAPAEEEDDDEDDSPLVVTSQTRPSFKPALIQELRKGTVRVKFEIQPNGSVGKQEIVSSSHRGLNSAALSAVGQWKFQPIQKPRQVQVEVGFNVDN